MEFPTHSGGPELPAPSKQERSPADDHLIKRVIIGSAIASVVVVIIVACLVALNIYTTNTPEYMLRQALTSLGEQKGIAGTASLDYQQGKNKHTEALDFIAFSSIANTGRSELSIGAGQGKGRVEATVRRFEDDTAYARITNAISLPQLAKKHAVGDAKGYQTPQAKEQLARVNDAWYTITTPVSNTRAPAAANLLQRTAKAPAPSDVQAAINLHADYPFLRVGGRLDDQLINGQEHARIRLMIDSAGLAAYLEAAQKDTQLSGVITPFVVAAAKRSLADGVPSIEVFINKDSRTFGRIVFVSPSQAVRVSADIDSGLPPGKTAVDRPSLPRAYAEAAADTQLLRTLFGL